MIEAEYDNKSIDVKEWNQKEKITQMMSTVNIKEIEKMVEEHGPSTRHYVRLAYNEFELQGECRRHTKLASSN